MLCIESQTTSIGQSLRCRQQFYTLDMIQVFMEKVVRLFDTIRGLQKEAARYNSMTPESMPGIVQLIQIAGANVQGLGFVSARKQTERIRRRGDGGSYLLKDFCEDLNQLCTRITEDMEESVFYSESDPTIVNRFSKRELDPTEPSGTTYQWTFKSPEELFEGTIVARFEEAADDISEACACYVFGRSRASVFHSMRIVEVGLLHVAKLAGIDDPKPSWGRVLKDLEKYALHTEYKDLPEKVKPHREKIRMILPRMQAVQHAWPETNVTTRHLFRTQSFSPVEAKDILEATEGFMRTLAHELP